MLLLDGVRKLKSDRADLHSERPKKKIHINRQPSDINQSNHSHISTVPTDPIPNWYHHGLQKKLKYKIRTGLLPIDATLDLHGYNQNQTIRELNNFLQQAINGECRFLLIIHGKGFRSESGSILRPLVQHWLSKQPHVLAFCPAQNKDGGSGASYVYI